MDSDSIVQKQHSELVEDFRLVRNGMGISDLRRRAALDRIQEQLRTVELDAEKWRGAAERMETAYTESVEQYEIVLANCKELIASNFAHIAEKESLKEQLEAMREALDWIEAEPEDPAKVQARARAVLYPASERQS